MQSTYSCWHRGVAALSFVTFTATVPSCVGYSTRALYPDEARKIDLSSESPVTVVLDTGARYVLHDGVEGIVGDSFAVKAPDGREVSVNLARVSHFEVEEVSVGKTVGQTLLAGAGITGALFLALLVTAMSIEEEW